MMTQSKSSIYSVDYILFKLKEAKKLQKRTIKLYDDIDIKISDTIKLIRDKGCICRKCKLQANYFIFNAGDGTYKDYVPLGFHAVYKSKAGRYINFTKDHVLPRAMGGANHRDNYQVLCVNCNGKSKRDNLYFKHDDYTIVYLIDRFFNTWLELVKDRQDFYSKLFIIKNSLLQKNTKTLSKDELQKILHNFGIAEIPKIVENCNCKLIKFNHSHLIKEETPILNSKKQLNFFQKVVYFFQKLYYNFSNK